MLLRMNNFKLARLRAGLRQADLARKLGVSESLVTKWETGRSRPSKSMGQRLEDVLGVDFEKLFADVG